MTRMQLVVWSSVFVAWRVVAVAGFLSSGSVVGVLFGVSELLAAVTTIYGLAIGRVDTSMVGGLLPATYCVPALFRAWGAPGVGGAWGVAFFTLTGCKWCVRLILGRACSVGVASWCRLVALGPYRVVRHPLSLIELGVAICFVGRYPSAWNVAVLGLRVVAGVVGVLLEERFLRTEPAYLVYAGRVRWRWVPGLW